MEGVAIEGRSGVDRPAIPGIEVRTLIGRGGHGSVYEGTRSDSGETVAVKVLSVSSEDGRDTVAQEARVMGRLSGHPNIVDLYEAGLTADGRPYLVLEHVPNGSLDDVVALGPLAWKRAVELGVDIAAALAHAHGCGVIHRDVKPSNVLLGRDDEAKLGDFGIARLAQRDGTISGPLQLSVMHAPPELFDGKSANELSDVYSLASTLYTLLCGRAPYQDQNDNSIISLIRRSMSGPLPEIEEWFAPDDVARTVLQGLARDPASRPAGAAVFGAELAAALDRSPDSRPPLPPKPDSAVPMPPAAEASASVVVSAPFTPQPVGSAPPPVAPPAQGLQPFPPPSFVPPSPRPKIAAPAPPIPVGRSRGEVADHLVPSAQSPLSVDTSDERRCALRPDFRFVHGPLSSLDSGVPFVCNDDLVRKLVNRLKFSTSGALLLTGFRGAGKTTVATRAFEMLSAEHDAARIVPIAVNVARATSLEELLTVIVRQLFERLNDQGLMPLINPEARRAIVLAYLRTSMNLKQTRGSSQETGGSLGFEKWGTKLGLSAKVVETLASEAQFVAYSDADLEYDLMRAVQLLRVESVEPRRGVLERLRLRKRRRSVPVRTIVMVDELDKLTATADGRASLDSLLGSMKTVMACPGLTFVFVGGADLHDRYTADVRRGNSIYESIFSWHVYVPCLWEAPDIMLGELITEHSPTIDPKVLMACARFESRGLPRRLLQHVNRHVRWDGDHAYFWMTEQELSRTMMLATIDGLVRDEADDPGASAAGSIEHDRQLLAAYYTTDWILRSCGAEFTINDVLREPESAAAEAAPIDPLLQLRSRDVESLIERLIEGEIVVPSRSSIPGVPRLHWLHRDYAELAAAAGMGRARQQEPRPEEALPDRTISPDTGTAHALADIAASLDVEYDGRTTVVSSRLVREAKRNPAPSSFARPDLVGGRYEVGDAILHGSLATTYRAVDVTSGETVAVKMVSSPTLLADPEARARIEREVSLAATLSHPNIVQTIDVLDLGDHGPVQVMTEIVGQPLRDVIGDDGMAAASAVQILIELAGAIGDLASKGVSRLGLSPSDIIVTPANNPVVVDFGLARRLGYAPDEITRPGTVVGELSYLAPEQRAGEQGSVRSDIYSLGVVLGEMLLGVGKQPRPAEDVFSWAEQLRDLASIELQWLLLSMLSAEPADRPHSAGDLVSALLETPEGGGLVLSAEPSTVPPGRPPIAQPPPAPQRRRVEVEGVECPRGHFNHPAALYCHLCGISLVHHELALVLGERPVLGWILIDGGNQPDHVIQLDRDVIIGRRPSAPDDDDVALVTLESGGLSRSHCRIRLDGWAVEVEDLQSVNGTFILQPGESVWTVLPPGESRPFPAGAQLRIDDHVVSFQAAYR